MTLSCAFTHGWLQRLLAVWGKFGVALVRVDMSSAKSAAAVVNSSTKPFAARSDQQLRVIEKSAILITCCPLFHQAYNMAYVWGSECFPTTVRNTALVRGHSLAAVHGLKRPHLALSSFPSVHASIVVGLSYAGLLQPIGPCWWHCGSCGRLPGCCSPP